MARYTPDRRGTRRYLQYSPELKRELHRRALLGVAAAAGLMHHRTGAMAASGHVEDDGPNGGVRGDRMQYSVVFDIPYAAPATWHNAEAVALDALRAAKALMSRGA